MTITDETITYVAALAKLSLSDQARQKAKEDLSKILGYMETMNGLDTEGVEPLSHVLPLHNVFREDIVTNQDGRDCLLSNAPSQKEGAFMVPKTVE